MGKRMDVMPLYVVAGMYELYEQLLPTKLYQVKKIKMSQSSGVSFRMCNMQATGKRSSRVIGMLSPRTKQVFGKTQQCSESELLRELQLVESLPA